MSEIIRNLFRRRLRTSLTVAGILIGIFAFTVLGSMAERMNVMVAGGRDFLTGQITVLPKSGGPIGGGFISEQTLSRLETVAGVRGTMPVVMMLADQDQGFTLGMPPMIRGIDLTADFIPQSVSGLPLSSGRMLMAGDEGAVVIGADIAHKYHAQVGDELAVRGTDFQVIGVIGKMMTAPDGLIFMPISDARRLYLEGQPFLKTVRKQSQALAGLSMFSSLLPPEITAQLKSLQNFDVDNMATAVAVAWQTGSDPELVADRLRTKLGDVTVLSPAEIGEEVSRASVVLNLIILGSAVIALIVGGLSVINTMTTAVMERTTEIGLKKALGARNSDLLREYLTEAGVIGFLGGVMGIGAGAVAVWIINGYTQRTGVQIFLLTPRLILLALAFSTVLGTAAGIYPALRAARLQPIEALREE